MTPDTIISLPGIGTISLLELERSVYAHNPVKWVEDKLGEFMWSGQRKMLNSVRDHRRSAFYSCHRIGKSMSMGRLAFWWLDTHLPGEAIVITSAHSAMQVKMALWREMARVHAKGKFPGRMNQTEYYMPMPDGREEMVAFGRKPEDSDTTGFQGTYSKYVLALGDEACFIPDALINGLTTLVSNEFSKIVLFGNPDDATTRFAKICQPGSGWNVIRFGYLNTPAFINDPGYEGSEEDREIDSKCPKEVLDSLISRTWVKEMEKEWGIDSPFYTSKVLGKFPQHSSDGLIPIAWIQAAIERGQSEAFVNRIQTTIESRVNDGISNLPIELGVDVGGGGDRNVISCRIGNLASILCADQNPDTMQTLSNILDKMRETGASRAKVDKVGIGWGACDRAREMSEDIKVKRETPFLAQMAGNIVGVGVGESAKDKERFVNKRAEGYWELRERFREGKIALAQNKFTERLAAQLCAIRYKRNGGRIQIESKEEMRKRGVASPDDADAVMLSFLEVETEGEDWYTW